MPEDNEFTITSLDAAGNSISSSHMVIFDAEVPELDSYYIEDQNGYRNNINDMFNVLNISSSVFGLNMSVDVKEWCLKISNPTDDLEVCKTTDGMPDIFVTDDILFDTNKNYRSRS